MRDIIKKRDIDVSNNKRTKNKLLTCLVFDWKKQIVGSKILRRINLYDLLVGGLYLVLIILLTWPLVVKIGSTIPGMNGDGGDSWHFLWNMWWIKKAILEYRDLFFTEYLFYPNGVNLVYHTLTIAPGLIVLFLSLFLKPVVAFNLVYLFFMWLAAWGTYCLANMLWKNRKGAFLAGLIFAFSPYFFAHSLGHFNLTVIWPFPVMGILLLKQEKEFCWKNSIYLGLLLAFLFLTDFHYFVFASLMVLVTIFYRLFDDLKIAGNIRWWGQYLVALVVTFVVIFPVLIKSLQVAESYMPTTLLSEVSYWSADVMAFFVPSFQNPFWGDIAQKYFGLYNFSGVESVIYVGWIVLFLGAGAFLFRENSMLRKRNWWLVILLVFLVMSLGPFLKIAGITDFQISDVKFSIPLPYLWLYKIPIMSIARVTARFYVVISLSLAVLAAYTYAYIEKRIVNKKNLFSRIIGMMLVGVLSLLILIDYSSWPMSLQSTDIPLVYDEIKKDQADFVILELPLWWTSGHRSQGELITKLQYYQVYHEKKILNGSVSRVPDALFDYYNDLPGIKYLIDVENNKTDLQDLDSVNVIKVMMDDLEVKYAVVHKKYYGMNDYYVIRKYFENILDQEIWYEDDTELVYKLSKK